MFFSFILAVVILFIILDLVENMDQFIDQRVPIRIVLLYYLFYIPYVLVLTLPVATLLAAVFSVTGMARSNEIVALKALGYSLYRLLGSLLLLGAAISMTAFLLAEVIVAQTNQKRMEINRDYLNKKDYRTMERLRNMQIQEGDFIVSIGFFDANKKLANRIKIEEIRDGKLLSRIDADSMQYNGSSWIIKTGYVRHFIDSREEAFTVQDSIVLDLSFSPEELIRAQGQPENMGYWDLKKYIDRVRRSGGDISMWLTELHLRVAFPLSNLLIILFAVPLAYNRRQKNIAVGFGISLTICFFYFGVVKLGQTLGQNGNLSPFVAAWAGNGLMAIGGVINLIKTRK